MNFDELVNILMKVNWIQICQAVAALWMALVATKALNTWKRQIKANQHIEFLDELTDTVHSYILLISDSVSSIKFAHLFIDSYPEILIEDRDIENKKLVFFIEKEGKSTYERIQNQLEPVTPVLTKMRSLVAKGQVLGIVDYDKCHDACKMLEWSYNQITAFASIVGSTSLNWEHPKVQQALSDIKTVNSTTIENNLTKQNSEFLKFVKKAYDHI